MAFWGLSNLELATFRPGILSRAEFGAQLTMAVMEIGPDLEDTGHEHPSDQCGVVLEGQVEMFGGEERKVLEANEAYFIPAGVPHGWKTHDTSVKILDVSGSHKPD